MDSFHCEVLLWNGMVLLVIALVTSLTNGVLLITVFRDPLRCFRNGGSALIACLAVTDFLTGTVTASNAGIFSILNSQGIPSLRIRGVLQEKLVSQFTVRSGILVVTAFTFERFLAVAMPHFYRNYVIIKNVNICALVCCTVGFLASIIELALDKVIFEYISYYGFFISPLILITICYLATYIALRKRLRSSKSTSVMPAASQQQRMREVQQLKRERLLFHTAFFVILGFVFSYSPWFSVVAITTYCPSCTKTRWYFALYRSTIPFLYVNSALNPLLYAWRIPRYRKSVAKMFGNPRIADESTLNTNQLKMPRNSAAILEPQDVVFSSAEPV
ncbi:adenosine receptor A1-like [Actinia tenebrosa]|uniref:Adenosine receptor A1-like n=1 Tax=Actinia tenebrosa TaxID=6105 RepID=A0A6P8HVT1_ACTTE|nr:adenosine receptor A1-like [Actinia tenebrosa]